MNPNDCYQVPVVVGAGISAATVSMLHPDVVVFDKGKFPGGRLSSKFINDISPFDFGATMFSDKMKISWLGQETNYSISEIWKSNSVRIPIKPIYDDTHFYPEQGMVHLVTSMLGDKKSIQSHTLKNIKLTEDKTWHLKFLISPDKHIKSIFAKNIILTLPIPQILEIFQNSENNQNLKRWCDFLENYNDYRKTLVSYFYWNNWKPNWKEILLDPLAPIPITTTLNRGENWEYQSWESIKYPNQIQTDSGLLVQFGAIFSETHFEDWMDRKKNPTPKSKEILVQGLKNFFGAPEPNLIWLHRWKYAQAQIPLLGKEGSLDLDSEKFEEWKKLCKETGITILGDWLFGAKIERIVGGISFLSHNNLLY
ncbi:NAD(P)-binding Rossmann-like domain protein [Leptospira bandrabouensis]|uniref:NAD(P)-binding Rossmann-like domain protein n=1 Tax=Leptospira bandrabouensis TaxID=2484903 RepID=A0A6H3NS03_9LEPT|nr:NAD(P)-binding Rossmann-like domain protein [Leptospira bandrabouensis]MCW7458972.1 NAD(P)-binding Rossmann-like domain protein [Leptospira bandrabouensis]MCW7478040.1 NAD(P)-binding Rossmann-like domain protein [Leptospira bandrabouensis]MCW7485838.1 NAD(P)-binding Rossmann-like domain protein [Leptospira bandrabouensis]TGN09962.1 NAD(P)-binding Rossmann-like domain protein [Leptospira bandrabouensis]TGN12380.1 NAD(P)-binding Rossmann-like domain protein [Leptospira bandrabouensis]